MKITGNLLTTAVSAGRVGMEQQVEVRMGDEEVKAISGLSVRAGKENGIKEILILFYIEVEMMK